MKVANSVTTTHPIRTLFITYKLPHASLGGAPLRNRQNINVLTEFGPVGVFCLDEIDQSNPDPTTPLAPPNIALCHVHTLCKSEAPTRTQRQLQLLRCLLTQTDPFTANHYSPDIAQALDRVLREFQPDLVIFEELRTSCYLSIVKRHPCKVIYDAHNAETALNREILSIQTCNRIRENVYNSLNIGLIESVERKVINKVDEVWTCSERDSQLLRSLTNKPLSITVVPNGVDVTYYNSVRLGEQSSFKKVPSTPHTIIFTASFGYLPNAIAAHWLLEKIYPSIQTLYPDCRLLLVGTNPTELMQKMAQHDPNLIVTGQVPDTRPYLESASIAIVPLLQGGGTRLKILEAFAAGRPVVSTSKGAEGIEAKDGVHLLIGNSVEEIVENIHRLWQEAATYQEISRTAYNLVNTNYSRKAIEVKLEESLLAVCQS